ncbi:MAG: DUF4870 domain-containing protein [Acidobacteria bacterium]|nr:MAG: DUF4870 domain-containing protein [Acidobacteriota bacterium]
MAQIPTPPPIPPAQPSAQASSNRTLMLVLSYLWILALVPLLVEKEDPEVQWHAKHGIVLMVAEIIFWIALSIVTWILTMLPVIGGVVGGLLGCGLNFLVWLAILAIHIVAIMKAMKGERLVLPVITDYANKWQ